MNEPDTRLCDAEGLAGLLDAMAKDIVQGRCIGSPLRLVGIRSRGVPIAERLARLLAPMIGAEVP
ncbi:bifunctional pyr operon transcriptional regulator/uracil phosphoribosyltransferase PyrR, partial [Singulisphaera rosea]